MVFMVMEFWVLIFFVCCVSFCVAAGWTSKERKVGQWLHNKKNIYMPSDGQSQVWTYLQGQVPKEGKIMFYTLTYF